MFSYFVDSLEKIYYVPGHISYRWVESDVHLQRHFRIDIVVLLWVYWAGIPSPLYFEYMGAYSEPDYCDSILGLLNLVQVRFHFMYLFKSRYVLNTVLSSPLCNCCDQFCPPPFLCVKMTATITCDLRGHPCKLQRTNACPMRYIRSCVALNVILIYHSGVAVLIIPSWPAGLLWIHFNIRKDLANIKPARVCVTIFESLCNLEWLGKMSAKSHSDSTVLRTISRL